MPDVLVIGGGVIGCATAYYLSRNGVSVDLLERGGIAGEASGAAAGILASLSGEDQATPALEALNRRSIELYRELLPDMQSTDIDVRYRQTTVLLPVSTQEETARIRQRIRREAALAGGFWLKGADVFSIEPEASPEIRAGYVLPDAQYVDPQRLTQALAEAARRLGVCTRPQTPVERFLHYGGRLRGVVTPAGVFWADSVVLAAGPWTGRMAERLGARVPVRPVRGQMISLQGPPRRMRSLIWGQDAYLVPKENGQTFVGATVEDVGFRKTTSVKSQVSLNRAAVRLAPSLNCADRVGDWAGLRPATPDGLPIMGCLEDWPNLWVSTGHFHHGILQAPASGALLAESILAGRSSPELAAFSPSRFTDEL